MTNEASRKKSCRRSGDSPCDGDEANGNGLCARHDREFRSRLAASMERNRTLLDLLSKV